MPQLTNPRHERFAQELAKGKPAYEAYQLAGYKPNDGNASVLKGKQKIADRVAELMQPGVDEAKITFATLIADADRIQRGAEADGQWAAANSALQTKSKLAGKWIDRKEIGEPGDFERLDDVELLQATIQEAKALGLPVPELAKPNGKTTH